MLKQRSISTTLDRAVAEYDGPTEAEPQDGVSFADVKKQWKVTEHTQNRFYNERLPVSERERIKQRENDAE